MSIAIAEEHRVLAESVSDFLLKRDSLGAARTLLETEAEDVPPLWEELSGLGWLGLHLPEAYGGSGYGMSELVVVVEQLGRALTPGPFIPSVVVSALVEALAPDEIKKRHLPGLASGTAFGAFALDTDVEIRAGMAYGVANAVLGGGLGDLLAIGVGDDVMLVDRSAAGVDVIFRANLDPTRRCVRMTFDGVSGHVLLGGARLLEDFARLIVSAEAIGIAAECTEQASEYAKVRIQFGRPIATYQAVKHHCAKHAGGVRTGDGTGVGCRQGRR